MRGKGIYLSRARAQGWTWPTAFTLPLCVASAVRWDRRQASEVWRAFQRLHLPPQDLDFIYTGLWKKLPVGKRLHALFPWVHPTCPFEGAQEDVYHRLKACSWMTVPVCTLQCTFPAVFS